ncbi:MAG: nucleoside/nucleotide kinase family protein [Nocardioides sp.]
MADPGAMTVDEAVRRAQDLAARPGVTLLGVTGQPGAGKSTLAALLVEAGPDGVLVGMDGYHLAHATLEAMGRVDRKGAPDTFDAAGYVALLRRVRGLGRADPAGQPETVWAPEFHRDIEDAVAGAVPVTAQTRLVVTEGNYLLLDDPPWDQVQPLLDECWFVDVPEDLRRARLQARHEHYGRTPDEARDRTLGSDESNAVLVAASRCRADRRVDGTDLPARSLD